MEELRTWTRDYDAGLLTLHFPVLFSIDFSLLLLEVQDVLKASLVLSPLAATVTFSRMKLNCLTKTPFLVTVPHFPILG